MNITQICRNNLHKRLGIVNETKRDSSAVWNEIKNMTNSLDVIYNLAKPRLIMGGIRYGGIDKDYSYVKKFTQAKLDEYHKTGNFEFLVDLVNCCAIEGVLKTHPSFHFKAEDRE